MAESSVDSTDIHKLDGQVNGLDGGNNTAKVLQETIYDLLSKIKDPEKPETLEDLNVISESGVHISQLKGGQWLANIQFVPTVPHCHLASIIGLSMRLKLQQALPDRLKVDIRIKAGTHDTAEEINKQINDKERISAALENPNLHKIVNDCINVEQD